MEELPLTQDEAANPHEEIGNPEMGDVGQLERDPLAEEMENDGGEAI